MRVLLEEVVLDLPYGIEAHAVGELDLVEGVAHEPLLAVVAPRPGDLVLVEDPEAHGGEPIGGEVCSRRLPTARLEAPIPALVQESCMSRSARSLPLAALVVLWCAPAAPAATPANDGPGALSHFDLARKDCVGTARNTTSKVWFTVANGVLSDVYFPTNDNTNVETLQYLVTDGSSFTDLQTRDTTYTVQATDDRALTCRVTTTAKSGRYKIVTDYTTDPSRPTVLIRSKFVALKGRLSDYRLYVRHDPTLNGNGGGGSATTENGGADDGALASAGGHTLLVGSDTVTKTNAANRDYAIPVYSALDVSRGFDQATNGFAGQPSDGLVQLDAGAHPLRAARQRGARQHRAGGARAARPQRPLHAGARLRRHAGQGGLRQPELTQARLPRGPPRLRARLERLRREPRQAAAPTRHLVAALERHPRRVLPQRQLREGHRGQDLPRRDRRLTDLAVGPGDLGRRPEEHVLRLLSRGLRARPVRGVDGGLPRRRPAHGQGHDALPLRATAAARRLDAAQQPAQWQARARQLQHPARRMRLSADHGAGRRADRSRPITRRTSRRRPTSWPATGPSFGPERWEEQSGFSPSTISAEIAGLIAAAIIADKNGDHDSARVWRATADEFQRNLKKWTLTTNGPLSTHPYFIRLSKNGDPNEAVVYNVGNGGPNLDQRSVIDAGFLEYARLGLLKPDDADILASLPVVDATIKRSTASGDGFLRYNGDGYGDGATDGHPWAPTDKGTGHPWPVLAGERGQYEVDRGAIGSAVARLDAMRNIELGRRPHPRAGVGPPRPCPRRPSAATRRRRRSGSATARPTARPRP